MELVDAGAQKIASGFRSDPVAPRIGSGAPTKRNVGRDRRAAYAREPGLVREVLRTGVS